MIEFDNHHNAITCPYCNPKQDLIRKSAIDQLINRWRTLAVSSGNRNIRNTINQQACELEAAVVAEHRILTARQQSR